MSTGYDIYKNLINFSATGIDNQSKSTYVTFNLFVIASVGF